MFIVVSIDKTRDMGYEMIRYIYAYQEHQSVVC